MSDYEKPPNHFEITAIISICALLFSAALRDLGHSIMGRSGNLPWGAGFSGISFRNAVQI